MKTIYATTTDMKHDKLSATILTSITPSLPF
jgi:hypothetical protein